MKNIVIENGRVIDPGRQLDRLTAVWISKGKIIAVGAREPEGFVADEIIDAAGCVVCPGLIDLSARLNSIEAELAAAVAGGVTHVVVPPDTDPPLDEPELADRLVRRAREIKKAKVLPLGALTQGLKGERLAELTGLKKVGCVAFSQAGQPIIDTEALMRAMEYAATFDYSVWLQAQDYWLSRNGYAHDGIIATRLGLAPIPVAAETIAIATLLQLSQQTGVRLHLTRLSSAVGVAMVRGAQKEGLPVTFDIGIHHLLMTEHDIGYFNPHACFNPPLRSLEDRAALSAAVMAGNVPIVSDHTPIATDDKQLPFGETRPGASGLETLLPLTLQWAEKNGLSLPRALTCLTTLPADILGIDSGKLEVGHCADICIFDDQEVWQPDVHTLKSRGKNTPYLGKSLRGRVRVTLVDGRVVYRSDS